MLDLLHITALRPGVSQNGHGPDPGNWDESKANPWPNLPDPLVLNSGKQVKTAAVWWTERHPQLVELFDHEILGRVPANVPAVHWEVASTAPGTYDGIAIVTKHLVGHVDNSAYPAITVNIEADLILPSAAPGHVSSPVPVVVELSGAYPPAPPRPPRPAAAAPATPPKPPAPEVGPPIEQQVLAKGWGYALLYHNTYQADNGAGLTQGIIGLCNHGQLRELEDWGVLRAWAWGASRLMDYLETDPNVDAHHVAIEGHSRRGKAALVAMAYEPRFVVAYISSSGAGGADLPRRRFGEQLENIAATGEYHWMGGNYLKYAELLPKEVTAADMPVDMHELIALCAPRPVLIDGGTLEGGDGWADTRGTFIAEVAAGSFTGSSAKSRLAATRAPLTPSHPSEPHFSPVTSPSSSTPAVTIHSQASPLSSNSPLGTWCLHPQDPQRGKAIENPYSHAVPPQNSKSHRDPEVSSNSQSFRPSTLVL
jgi:hypothetical protein